MAMVSRTVVIASASQAEDFANGRVLAHGRSYRIYPVSYSTFPSPQKASVTIFSIIFLLLLLVFVSFFLAPFATRRDLRGGA